MSGNADIIKEFLVALGFKVDGPSYKKFTDSLEGTSKGLAKVGTTIASVGAALFGMTLKIAEGLEQLHYAAQRTGSTVSGILSTNYAISQLGGTADEAQASLENLGHFIRSYPGSGKFLEHLGVEPGHVKDAAAAMKDLEKTFQHMSFWQAQPYANVLGISEKTLLALQSGDYSRYINEYNTKLKYTNVNIEDAAKQSVELERAWRQLGATVDILGGKIENAFGPWITRRLLEMDQLLVDTMHSPSEVSKTFTGNSSSPSRQQQVIDTFVKRGWTTQQAIGLAAMLRGENSSFDPGKREVGGQGYGIAQWGSSRRKDFAAYAARMGWGTGSDHDIYGSTLDQQLQFMNYELTWGKEKSVGAHLKTLTSARDVASEGTILYERPADKFGQAKLRGDVAAGMASHITINTDIKVSGVSDPNQAAGIIGEKMGDVYKQWQRNMQGAVQ